MPGNGFIWKIHIQRGKGSNRLKVNVSQCRTFFKVNWGANQTTVWACAIAIHARLPNLPGTLRIEKSLSCCCYLSAFIPYCTLVMPVRNKWLPWKQYQQSCSAILLPANGKVWGSQARQAIIKIPHISLRILISIKILNNPKYLYQNLDNFLWLTEIDINAECPCCSFP